MEAKSPTARRIEKVRLENSQGTGPRRPSRVTVPAHANPLAKLLFSELARQNVTYAELEEMSGILVSTVKGYRLDNTPGLESISACLGALGWSLVPVPHPEHLPAHVVEALEAIGEHFRSDEEALGAAVLAAAQWPVWGQARQRTTLKAPKRQRGAVANEAA